MQTIPTLPRIGHSAPMPFEPVEVLAARAQKALRELGRRTEGSPDRSHASLSKIAFSAAGQIGVHAGGIA